MSEKAAFFDVLAARGLFDAFGEEERPKVARLLACLDLRPGMVVAEPGCGSGRLTALLAEAVGPTGRVIAGDISPAMIARARRRRLGRHVRRCVAEAGRMRLRAGGVDRVVCFQSFPHFDDPLGALRHFRRALKPDGMLAIVHFISRARVNALHSGSGGPIAADLLPGRRRMRALLQEGGFEVVLLEDGPQGYWLLARCRPPAGDESCTGPARPLTATRGAPARRGGARGPSR